MAQASEGPQARTGGDDPLAVGYVRYSTPSQDENQDGDQQLEAIQHHAQRHGYHLDDVYKDVVTGRRADRVEYTSLLSRISNRNDVDKLITCEVSRIGRDQGIAAAYLVAKAEAAGVDVETTNGSKYDFGNPEDKLRFRILQAVAEYEIDVIQARMQRGKRAGAKRGYWVTGPAPTGYETEGPQGRKVLVPTEAAPLVREVYERYVDGESQRAIADWSRTLDTEAGDRLPVSMGGIGRILRNRVYRGKITWEGEEYDGQHAALVSEELWRAVKRRRER